jgi:hypothetical protein
VIRAFPLAAAALLVACFTDAPPSDLSAGPQSTGALTTGSSDDTAVATTTSTATTDATTSTAVTGDDTTSTTDPGTTDPATTAGTTTAGTTTAPSDTTTGVTANCEPLAYSTEFDELDGGWTPLTAGWAVAEGFYTNMNLAPSSATWRPGENYPDAVVSLTLEVPKAGRAGLLFRLDGDGALTGYYVSVEPDEQDVGFGTVINGEYDQSWSDPAPVEPGKLLTLTAVFAGEELSIEVDGHPLVQGLAIPQFEVGGVGLFTSGTAARFDALHVCVL